jgi:tetratricopeptide (TPR) repeat protein
MQYAVYAEVATVQSAVHAHELLLDLLIEQGAAGLVAFVLLVVATVRMSVAALRNSTGLARRAAEAALASQAAVLVHGLFDDALYGSRGLPALFLPAGVALAVAAIAPPLTRAPGTRPRSVAALAGALAIVTCLVGLVPQSRAALRANLGAVRQARAELSLYDQARFDALTLDEVRRQVDLEAASADLRRALEIAPAQPTASRRLAMIALSRGHYHDAWAIMDLAWAAGHQDYSSRWLLSDALVANGRIDLAVRLLEGQPGVADRLKSQAWYRYWRRGDFTRAHDAWIVAARLDPADTEAPRMAAEAASRLAAGAPP